jgi:beta-glucosidase
MSTAELPAGSLAFPAGFLWGTATAAHQVEGGNENNDWWAWEQYPGRIVDGTRSGLACDWWHRAEEDLALAARGGQNSHRLSLEWSRLEPQEGRWSEAAVARYRQILTAMRDLGLEPLVTLWHFSLPLWLYEQGGWENERCIGLYLRFVERALDAFGDLCHFWCTINEPEIYAYDGYVSGKWPPGRGGLRAARTVLRHLALAHARAYVAIHQRQPAAQVGLAKHLRPFDPADPRRWADRAAAGLLEHLFNEAVLAAFCEGTLLFPLGWARKRQGASRWVDYIGLNYYSRDLVTLDLARRDEFYLHRFADPQAEYSMDGWGEIHPQGLTRALLRLAEWRVPLYVTEFGIPDNDDSQRPRFILSHVAAIHRAWRAGADVRGAYFWSLVDNFEWAAGWSARFGLIGLDPQTQQRTPRGSAAIYARIAQANALPADLVRQVAPELAGELLAGSPAGGVPITGREDAQ